MHVTHWNNNFCQINFNQSISRQATLYISNKNTETSSINHNINQTFGWGPHQRENSHENDPLISFFEQNDENLYKIDYLLKKHDQGQKKRPEFIEK